MSGTVFEHPDVLATLDGASGTLTYRCREAAGAIGRRQGEALLAGLSALEATGCRTLTLRLSSAGAHFGEPLQGLLWIDRLIRRLGDLQAQGMILRIECDGWLYGGMAMASAACADTLVLASDARLGLFGRQVLPTESQGLLPEEGFEPPGLTLVRLPDGSKTG